MRMVVGWRGVVVPTNLCDHTSVGSVKWIGTCGQVQFREGSHNRPQRLPALPLVTRITATSDDSMHVG
jgi:hypothetical protein